MLDLTVVLATRNEEDNIVPLQLALIDAFAPEIPFFVYADDSDDLSRKLITASPFPHLLIARDGEERTGLQSALVQGIALSPTRWIAVMDADFQHPPATLAIMYEQIGAADYISATRYLKGGNNSGLNGWHRQLLSNTLRWIPKIALDLSLTDPLTNFCLFRKDLVDIDQLQSLVTSGAMRIQPALLLAGHFESIVEVPFAFSARKGGESKMTTKQGLRFFREMFELWKWKHFHKQTTQQVAFS